MNAVSHVSNMKPKMRNSYVPRNDWLKYAVGIAHTASENLDDKCVYAQLVEYLLNPPSGTMKVYR